MKLKLYLLLLTFISLNYAHAQSQADYLNFDGVDDYVSLTNTYNSATDFTIETWIKTEADGTIVFSNSAYDNSYLAVSNGKLTYTTGRHGYGGFILTSNQNVDDNIWHHVAITMSSLSTNGLGNLYIDGVLDVSASLGIYTVPMGSLTIGSLYNGSIDELRIWNVIRTAAEIDVAKSSEIQCNETGLVAYYQFNKGIDAGVNTNVSALTDVTGNGNNGTLTNFALTGTSSNWLAGSPIISLSSPPTVVSPVQYAQDATATALTAILGLNGVSLSWYTDAIGGYGSSSIIPSTTTLGSTSYYVSSINANGCESERAEIVVEVALPATHLNFDGINDFVTINNTTEAALTLEAYVKTSIQSPTGTYAFEGASILDSDVGGVANDFSFSILNNKLSFYDGNANVNLNGIMDIVDGNWHHVAMVRIPGESISLYIDGVLDAQVLQAGTDALDQNPNIYIGYNYNLTRLLNADIDDVRIWNTARTENQINSSKNCELQGTETGLLAYYQFNQGLSAEDNVTITTLTDATANANNGTLTNFALTSSTSNFIAGSPVITGSTIPSLPSVSATVSYSQDESATALIATTGDTGLLWYTTEVGGIGETTAPTPSTDTVGSTSYWVTSTNDNGCESERVEIVVTVYGPATHLNFDGVDDKVSIGNIIPNESSYTKEALVYNTVNSGARNILSSDKNPFWISNGIISAGNNNNYTVVQDETIVADDTWVHVAVTYDAPSSTMRLYKDGVVVATNTSAPVYVAEESFIGSHNGIASFFQGNIDDVRVWNTARTASQINASKNCELQGTETGLLAYYKFNQGFDAQDNSAITTLTDATTNGNDGALSNFALTGTSSNWLSGSPVITGSEIPSAPIVTTPIIYTEGDTASELTATSEGSELVWYTTETGGTGDSIAPTPSTDTLGSTSYWVSSINDNGCESERMEIVVTVEAVLGTGEAELMASIRVYPNPTNGLLTISNIMKSNLQVVVYDINGRLLLNKNCDQETNNIDISNFSNGIYILKMKTKLGEISKRVIKK